MKSISHHWTGWPGAICMHCGTENAIEYAIGMGFYDPYTNVWIDSPEAQKVKVESEAFCSGGNVCGECPQCKKVK